MTRNIFQIQKWFDNPHKVKKISNEHYAWGLAIPKLRDLRECDILIPPRLGALGQHSPDTAKKAYPEMGPWGPPWLLRRNSRSPCWSPLWSCVDARRKTAYSPHRTQAGFDQMPWSAWEARPPTSGRGEVCEMVFTTRRASGHTCSLESLHT